MITLIISIVALILAYRYYSIYIEKIAGVEPARPATQSPLMAKCIANEKLGRRVFYGAMLTESLVAMIWAAISMSFFGGTRELNAIMAEHQGNAAWVVNEISNYMTAVISTYLFLAPEGFFLSKDISYITGMLITLAAISGFIYYKRRHSFL